MVKYVGMGVDPLAGLAQREDKRTVMTAAGQNGNRPARGIEAREERGYAQLISHRRNGDRPARGIEAMVHTYGLLGRIVCRNGDRPARGIEAAEQALHQLVPAHVVELIGPLAGLKRRKHHISTFHNNVVELIGPLAGLKLLYQRVCWKRRKVVELIGPLAGLKQATLYLLS